MFVESVLFSRSVKCDTVELLCSCTLSLTLLLPCQIPFVVIVDPHLLKDKGSVRLRRVLLNDSIDTSNTNNSEHYVEIKDLAWTINSGMDENVVEESEQATLNQNPSSNMKAALECIYVDHGQYYESNERNYSSANWKAVKKSMKGILQRGENFVSTLADPFSSVAGESVAVFAVTDMPFWSLREFGSVLMKRENEQGTSSTCLEVADRHPQYKRSVKTLGVAIDNYMKRRNFWVGGSNDHKKRVLVPLLLYSKSDDRFDMITLSCHAAGNLVLSPDHGKNRRK